MTRLRVLIVTLGILLPLLQGQETKPPRIAVTEARSRIGEMAMVCGKVVGSSVPKYGIAGHGKPVSFYVDQPETNPVFYFVAFGKAPDGPEEVVNAYQGKRVCVTGKVDALPSGGAPFIMAADREQIQIDASKQ